MKRVVCIAALTVVLALTVSAQDSANQPETTDETALLIEDTVASEAPVTGRLGVFTAWDFIRMILILGAVIGVIYLVFYLLKRSGNPKLQENRLIRVLSSRLIANGKSIHLIEVGNQVFLVGAAESNLSLLSEIIDKETLDGIRLQAANHREGEKQSFTEILSQMFGKEHRSTEKPVDAVGFLRAQRQRIKQL